MQLHYQGPGCFTRLLNESLDTALPKLADAEKLHIIAVQVSVYTYTYNCTVHTLANVYTHVVCLAYVILALHVTCIRSWKRGDAGVTAALVADKLLDGQCLIYRHCLSQQLRNTYKIGPIAVKLTNGAWSCCFTALQSSDVLQHGLPVQCACTMCRWALCVTSCQRHSCTYCAQHAARCCYTSQAMQSGDISWAQHVSGSDHASAPDGFVNKDTEGTRLLQFKPH